MQGRPAVDHTVEFIEEQHIYLVDGLTIVPSVTQIMKPMSEAYYTGISEETMREAADRGTRVHKAIEDLEKGVVTLPEISEDILPYVKNYLIAKHIKGFKPIHLEYRMTDGEYAGTIDQVAEMKGKIIIIDYKATSKYNRELAEVQLAGYDWLSRYNGIIPDEHYILHLTRETFKFNKVAINYPKWNELKHAKLRALRND